jgi:hypothetical protein
MVDPEMKVKMWQQRAVHRAEWESVIKESKALRGRYGQGVHKLIS